MRSSTHSRCSSLLFGDFFFSIQCFSIHICSHHTLMSSTSKTGFSSQGCLLNASQNHSVWTSDSQTKSPSVKTIIERRKQLLLLLLTLQVALFPLVACEKRVDEIAPLKNTKTSYATLRLSQSWRHRHLDFAVCNLTNLESLCSTCSSIQTATHSLSGSFFRWQKPQSLWQLNLLHPAP